MKIEFIKNVQFSKLVKVDGQLREFNFRKVSAINEERFTVDFNDDRNRRIVFNMRKEDGSWKIISPEELPDAISQNEIKFHEVIEEESKASGS